MPVGDPDPPLCHARRDCQHRPLLCSDLAPAITGAQYIVDSAPASTGGAVTQAMQS
jgi:hypothetical protein